MSAIPQEIEVPKARWDLSVLFSSLDDPKVEETWKWAEKETAELGKFRGKIEGGALSPAELARAVKQYENLIMQMSKPLLYGHLRFAVEATNPEIGAFLQKQMERGTSIRVDLIFFDLEIQNIPESRMEEYYAAPELKDYVHFLKRVREATPYMLSEIEERILEETANTGTRAWTRLHDEVLTHHKFKFTCPNSGEVHEYTESEVLDLLRNPDRRVRENAGHALSEGLNQLNHVLTYIFNTLLLDKKVGDTLRKHPYAEHSRHMENELDKETVDLVMRLCKEYEKQVADYYTLKREILGLPELTHIDRYAPIFESTEKISYEDARTMCITSFEKFSPLMAQKADEFFSESWIDAEPREGKTGGAFCSYLTPDTHPVIMMSYLNKMDNVMTLAHELGHGVHSSLSREQSYFNFDGSLPLAELSSIFCEQLVFEAVTKDASAKENLALYAEKIEGIFASVFRQAAMFRFEQRCHEARRTEGELSSERIGDIWQEEIQGMFGTSIKVGDEHKVWWSYVGHFIFAPFYVYAYSFGELLTLAIYEKARHEGPSFADKYTDVLRLGGSRSPQELMSLLGVDLKDEAFWRGGFAVIENMIGKFRLLWSEHNN